MLVRSLGLAVTVLIAGWLSGCGATLPTFTPGATASISSDSSNLGAAYPTTRAERTDDGMPTPFSDPNATASGGREVIQNPKVADIMAPSPLPEMSWGRP